MMLGKLRALGVMTLAGLWVGSACTVKDAPDPGVGGSATFPEGGAAGSPQGGKGGKAGSAATAAGSSGKGGSGGSKGGSSGSAGTPEEAGAGGGGPGCESCASGVCLEDGTCVDCLPEDDRCPQGQYCNGDNECTAGCKADGSSCASGVCQEDHNCKKCIADDECMPGLVCANGTCAPTCSAEHEGTSTGCSAEELTCCSLHCTDLVVDSQNCGACGTSCGAAQFCGLNVCPELGAGGRSGSDSCVTCQDVTLSNLCAVAKVIVVLDTNKNDSDGNRSVGREMGQALASQCETLPAYTEVEQDSAEALNFTTGQPVSRGGELLVVAGGPFFQNLEGYVEEHDIAPLYWKVSATVTEYRKTSNDEVVVSLPIAGDHDSHDLFVIQFMRDAASGSLVLNAQGFWLSGTVAAAYQLTHGILPNLASAGEAWYAYDWTDKDGDKAPDDNEITLLASGS